MYSTTDGLDLAPGSQAGTRELIKNQRLLLHVPFHSIFSLILEGGVLFVNVTMCRAKIHRATVTGAELDYEGSLTIDGNLMDEVGILEFEKILVSNLTNGNRFETYAIKTREGSCDVILNGATAHLGKTGDQIIIFAFAEMDHREAKRFKPTVIVLDKNNRIVRKLP